MAISLPPAGVAATVAEVGIGFCFAPVFHPSFRHTAAPRRELGVPTVFNFLGPLTNPAQPLAGAIGCGDRRMAPVMADVFAARTPAVDVLVFCGDDGLDELTTTTTSSVWSVSGGQVTPGRIDPIALGLSAASAGDLRGGDVEFNVEVARRVFDGEPGPVADAVALNAAAAIAAYAGLSGDLEARPGGRAGARPSGVVLPGVGRAGRPLGGRVPARGRQGDLRATDARSWVRPACRWRRRPRRRAASRSGTRCGSRSAARREPWTGGPG